MLLNQHQQSMANVASANRGWTGAIGVILGSCFNLKSLPIAVLVSPDRSINNIMAKYLDSRLTEGQK